LGYVEGGGAQKAQKPAQNVGEPVPPEVSKVSKAPFEPFDTGHPNSTQEFQLRTSGPLASRQSPQKRPRSPGGDLTPARCHEPGCNGRLKVSGIVRKCSECGAEIERWAILDSIER
jgi:hypothetical protein